MQVLTEEENLEDDIRIPEAAKVIGFSPLSVRPFVRIHCLVVSRGNSGGAKMLLLGRK